MKQLRVKYQAALKAECPKKLRWNLLTDTKLIGRYYPSLNFIRLLRVVITPSVILFSGISWLKKPVNYSLCYMKKSNIRFTADKDFASKDSGYKKVAKSSINASTTVIQILSDADSSLFRNGKPLKMFVKL